MADGGEIAALFATLGLKVNAGQWAQGNAQIGQAQTALGRLGTGSTAGLRQAQTALGQLGAGASSLSKLLGGVAPAANQAGSAAASAGHQAAAGFDAAGAAIKGYLMYLGAHVGYEKLIKFNEEMETSIISLSAVIEGNLGGSYQAANAQAKDLYAGWQKFSTQTPVQTADLLEFGKNIAAATFSAGGKVKDLQELTQQGVIAAQVLAGNRGAGYASLEITEMLMGNVSNRMMMARQILGFVKMTEEQFRSLDAAGRLKTVKQALSSDAFKDAAKAFSSSFVGVTSTMWDKINIGLGKVGVSLFGKLTGAVSRFNDWFDAHQETIEAYGKAVGEWLGGAFDTVSLAIETLLDYGAQALDWLSQYIDTGEMLKSLMIALGIVLTVFAIQSAIAFATNPITLTIMAIAALVYAIRWLMQHPEKVRKAFHDAWEAIKSAAAGVAHAITVVFEALAGLPVISALLGVADRLLGWSGSGDATSTKHEKMLEDSSKMNPEEFRQKYPDAGRGNTPFDNVNRLLRGEQPVLTAPGATSANKTISIGTVAVGDITVHSPNADPVAVGDQVRKVFHEELGGTLRKTMDVYG